MDATDLAGDTADPPCTSHADCDDGIDCTTDLCTVAGTCTNEPDDDECAEGRICSPIQGCVEGCSSDEDCDNGVWCDGDERCFGTTCLAASPPVRNCDDGNECTIDVCNEDLDSCEYTPHPECDADAPTDPLPGEVFDPAIHYAGLFDIAPMVEQECGNPEYHIGQVAFSNDGTTLTVNAGPFTLTGDAPVNENFSVTGDHSCMRVTFGGGFINSDNFIATWTETKISSCFCSAQEVTVGGVRH
jgi:hypothetical protein